MSLSGPQAKAIAALLASKSIKEAARKTGVDESTMRRWLAQPEFAAEYAKELRGVMAVVSGRLRSASLAALDALEEVVRSKKTTAMVRVIAASKLLDLATKHHQFDHKHAPVEDDSSELDAMSTEEMEKAVGDG